MTAVGSLKDHFILAIFKLPVRNYQEVPRRHDRLINLRGGMLRKTGWLTKGMDITPLGTL